MALSVDQVLLKARRHARKGETALAAQLYRGVLDNFPQNPRALKGLKALAQVPQGKAPAQLQSQQARINAMQKLIAYYRQGQLRQTLKLGDELAERYPDIADIPKMLGAVNTRLGRLNHAVSNYSSALRLTPDDAGTHTNLGIAQRRLGKFEQAISSYSRALQIQPENADTHYNLGNALNDLGRYEEAVASYSRALQIKPDYVEAHSNLGAALKDLGKFQEAQASYRSAVQLKPDFVEAHWQLGGLVNYTVGDPQIEQIKALLQRSSQSNHDRIRLNFALGKAYSDIGHYSAAFTCFERGNGLRKQQLNYNIATDRTVFANIRATFTSDTPLSNYSPPTTDESRQRPILIVGMPRSGTTLVEQILASHSQVHGAGELSLLHQIVKTVNWRSADLNTIKFRELRHKYLAGLAGLGAPERLITDKMPLNFLLIGFVLTAIPEARIIHTQRDARATCWSNFRQYFSKQAEYSCDLQDLAQYYGMYRELMDFWHEKFPGKIYDLSYEALTEQQEAQTRQLLEYVGLEWQDQCLDFHNNRRAVTTASAMQVRQKMYTGSSLEWRKYEQHLGPMIEALEGF